MNTKNIWVKWAIFTIVLFVVFAIGNSTFNAFTWSNPAKAIFGVVLLFSILIPLIEDN